MFLWTESSDPDPLDSVLYTLYLAVDSNFTFVNEIPDISDSSYTCDDSLTWGTQYWWKVKAEDQFGGETWSEEVLNFRTVTLGDADGNGVVEISDAVFMINYIFIPGSPEPYPMFAGDADCNGIVEISDAVYLISYIFIPGSPEPCYWQAPATSRKGNESESRL